MLLLNVYPRQLGISLGLWLLWICDVCQLSAGHLRPEAKIRPRFSELRCSVYKFSHVISIMCCCGKALLWVSIAVSVFVNTASVWQEKYQGLLFSKIIIIIIKKGTLQNLRPLHIWLVCASHYWQNERDSIHNRWGETRSVGEDVCMWVAVNERVGNRRRGMEKRTLIVIILNILISIWLGSILQCKTIFSAG